jgi:3-phosphoshikimate 1-carboxyvinyltransferase
LTGLHTLRVKETDRIAALANELRKVGCTVETTEDSISITPPGHRRDARDSGEVERGPESRGKSKSGSSESCPTREPIVIETYNDHRMAMAFAVLGLARPRLAIRNPACVAKSYPGFWTDFAKLYGEGTETRRH